MKLQFFFVRWKIGQTPWRRIRTNQGHDFYYNVNTKESAWKIPLEVKQFVEALLIEKQRKEQMERQLEQQRKQLQEFQQRQIVHQQQLEQYEDEKQRKEEEQRKRYEEEQKKQEQEEEERQKQYAEEEERRKKRKHDEVIDPWALPNEIKKPKLQISNSTEERLVVFKVGQSCDVSALISCLHLFYLPGNAQRTQHWCLFFLGNRISASEGRFAISTHPRFRNKESNF